MLKRTMKAAWMEELGKPLVIKTDVPVPEPGPGEVLVRVRASGVCHTDVEVVKGVWTPVVEFVKTTGVKIPGHEGAGEVEEVGPGVTLLKKGDRVGVPMLNDWCGSCEYCLRGNVYWCPRSKLTAFTRNGTFAQYAVISEKAAPKIPDQVSYEQAGPLMCAGITVYNAVRRIPTQFGIQPGKPIAIVGAAGGLGHYAVQIAKAFGYKVAGIDIEERLKLVEDLGADWAVNAREAVDVIKNKLGGVYAAVVTATKIGAYETAMKILKPCGTVIVVGCPASGEGPIPTAVPVDIVLTGTRIIPSMIGATPDFEELFALVADGKVKGHIARTGSLEDLNKIIQELEEYKYTGRAVVTID